MSKSPRKAGRPARWPWLASRRRAACSGLLAGALMLLSPQRAQAWDPSTTAQALLDAAVRRSGVHVRWMESSQMQFGLYSNLQLDPAKLDPQTRLWLRTAIRNTHADTGATPRGGPGACPGADAPTELLRNCVSGDLWELSAIGWMRLGIVLEGQPRDRLLHHFVDAQDPLSESWSDRSGASPRQLRQGLSRAAGEPAAGRWTGTNFDGRHASAIAFLQDPNEPFGPFAVAAHERLAVLSTDPRTRTHHRAMALLATGATLRVIMDAGLPAYARADASAFMQALSATGGDRGEPMVEYVRTHFGQRLPLEPIAAGTRPSGKTIAPTLVAHIAGDDAAGVEGLANFSASHFLSAGTLPEPAFVEAHGDGASALKRWLGDDDLGLDPVELQGAKLTPWPSTRGYALNAQGRPLFAFTRDEAGFTRAFVDQTIFADAAAHLLPAVVQHAASALDLLHGGGANTPPPAAIGNGLIWEFALSPDQLDAQLHVFHEGDNGERSAVNKVPLKAAQTNRVVGIAPAPEGQRLVFVVDWATVDGLRRVAEHRASQ